MVMVNSHTTSLYLWQVGIHKSVYAGITLGLNVDGPMAHQHSNPGAIRRGYGGHVRPPLGSRGNAPVGGPGGRSPPGKKMIFMLFCDIFQVNLMGLWGFLNAISETTNFSFFLNKINNTKEYIFFYFHY